MDQKTQTAFIAKLNQMTQAGDLQWFSKGPPNVLTAGTDKAIPSFYSTYLNGKTIALFTERIPLVNIDEPTYNQNYNLIVGGRPTRNWTERLVLMLMDGEKPLWEFSGSAGLNDLWTAVQAVTSRVDDYVKGVLSSE
jgi:hypothetical protein